MQINYRESNRASLLTVHRTVVVQLIGPLVPGRALALHVVLVDARDECPASAVRLHVAESLEVGNKIRLLQAQKVHWVSFDTKSLLPHTHLECGGVLVEFELVHPGGSDSALP